MSASNNTDSYDPHTWFASQLAELYPDVTAWEVKPKVRGRHTGCILASADGSQLVFVKRQLLCLQTMLVYRILARIGCGPIHTLFRVIPSGVGGAGFDWGVATSGVPGFQMQSERQNQSHEASCSLGDVAQLDVPDAIAMILLTCCLQLNDIPYNADNWGIQCVDTSHRLAIVDFSFGAPHSMSSLIVLSVSGRFLSAVEQWTSQKVVHDASTQATFNTTYGKTLGSIKAFDELLSAAMDDVCAWVNDDTRQHAWRRSLTLSENMKLLEQLHTFQDNAQRRFRTFAAWWFGDAQ